MENAKKVWALHENKVITAYISPITAINVFYIVRKQRDLTIARTAVHLLLQSLNLCTIGGTTLVLAYESSFTDFEDATQHAVAIEAGLDAIITRNPSDYKSATLPIYSSAVHGASPHKYPMTDLETIEDEPYDYTFEEALNALIADFVTDRPYVGCLATLFRMPKGEWVSLEQLCRDVPPFPANVALYNLPPQIPSEVFVAWLDHPWNDEGNDFVIIPFYCDREMFNSVAIYNRRHFWEKYQ